MKKILVALLSLCIYSTSSAQMKKMGLLECVMYALENNISIAQFELDLENAALAEKDALGGMLPRVNGSISLNESKGLILDPQTQTNTIGTILSGSAGLSFGYTIFDGLRTIKRAQRAQLNSLATQYRVADLKDDISLAVANAYLRVISSKESLKVAQAQYKITEQDLKRTQELVASGVVPRGDLLEIEATAANQEQQVVNAENSVIISRINLAQLLQITDYENFDIADESFEVPSSTILEQSAKSIFNKALTFRNDIQVSKFNVALAQQDYKLAKGQLYPTLNAFLNYNTFASDQFRLEPNLNENPADPTDDFSLVRPDVITQLYTNDGINYGLSLNIPIFNGFATSNNVKRAEINVKRSELQFEQAKLDLENTVNQAYVDVKSFAKAYEAAQKTLEARRLAYQYAKERFDVGLMNAFNFSQAQARLDNAEANVIRTKYDYIFRLKVLEFYFGLPLAELQ
ncbi:MAG: TolC family protein [Flavobacteriaceae bacterium]|jgi:outer membrane protein|nr:TolC family protein [Flavobacteriaceae bacterium]